MIALPGQLFYSTQIPACLRFHARNKNPDNGWRNRRGDGITAAPEQQLTAAGGPQAMPRDWLPLQMVLTAESSSTDVVPDSKNDRVRRQGAKQ